MYEAIGVDDSEEVEDIEEQESYEASEDDDVEVDLNNKGKGVINDDEFEEDSASDYEDEYRKELRSSSSDSRRQL